MPVIQLSLSRLELLCKNKASGKKILEMLPYLGLDIEDHSGDTVSVEYSPNRPDFSSEVGIARSLSGLLGIETGPPHYSFAKSNIKITIEGDEVTKVRPVIQGLYAEIKLTDGLIKQLIAMQEDLHNGIGRRRSKVAIGIHNASIIDERIRYYAVTDEDFSFVPLGSSKRQTIREILTLTDQGLNYGKLLSRVFPMLEDSKGNVLSMPPIINGDLTRLEQGVSEIFVDVTGTDEYAVEASVAIIASMLSDSGGRVFQVEVSGPSREPRWVPDMTERKMPFDLKLSNEILGFDFDFARSRDALEKSRLGLDDDDNALIPKFRSDVIHPIDLAEELALGYGIWRITPQIMATSLVGSLNPRMKKIDSIIEVLVGLGLTEIWNLSLLSREVAEVGGTNLVSVQDSKSLSFEFLREDVLSSLLQVLGSSTHEEYPQAIFEEAPTFSKLAETVSGILEEEHVAVLFADSKDARYSQIRSRLDAFLRMVLPVTAHVRYEPAKNSGKIFASGRTAEVYLDMNGNERRLGVVGEVSPETLSRFGIPVPVAGFELNLEPLLKG